jgi:hypothetical protein
VTSAKRMSQNLRHDPFAEYRWKANQGRKFHEVLRIGPAKAALRRQIGSMPNSTEGQCSLCISLFGVFCKHSNTTYSGTRC